ncbi:hypothetical protein ACFC08_28595 [Streptomyces sp. NPDC056112]|uniref:hypothetical protein n=1 Tax=Streptomyces sp. NPDC056112 TaxID=3345715 RepID=UPI0035DE3F27
MQELRLVDSDGYTVPDTDPQVRQELRQLAADHAAQWADFGYDARDYRVTWPADRPPHPISRPHGEPVEQHHRRNAC